MSKPFLIPLHKGFVSSGKAGSRVRWLWGYRPAPSLILLVSPHSPAQSQRECSCYELNQSKILFVLTAGFLGTILKWAFNLKKVEEGREVQKETTGRIYKFWILNVW